MKEKILRKFNDSTYELSMLMESTRNNLSDDINRHLNNLSRILYETFESILKYQIDKNADFRTKRDVSYRVPDRRKLLELFDIHKLTLEEDQADTINYDFLMKIGKIINDSKHNLNDSVKLVDLEKFYNEVYRMINIYVDNKKKLRTIDDLEVNEINGWDTFYSVCNKFQKESRNYILVVDKFDKNREDYLKNISLLPWNLIIDFDYFSREDGFYSNVFAKESPLPTIINLNDNTSVETFAINHHQHYHYFINSYKNSGISKPISYDEWQRKYENKFDLLIQNFASKFNFNTKVVFLSDSLSDDFVLRIGETIRKHFSDLVDFVFAIKDMSELAYPFKKLKGHHIPISIVEVSQGVSKFSFNFGIKDLFADKIVVPHLEETATSNVSGVLNTDFFLKLENDFEVVHKGLDAKIYDEVEDRRDFLCGFKQISWYGLRNDWDKKHPSLKGLKGFLEIVKTSLKKAKGKLELVHEAGYGGTTIARRIAWEFHNDYPTLILKEYRGQVTVDYITKLYDQTRKTVFIIIEAPQAITLDEIDTFYRALLGKNRPFLFLVVRRGDSNFSTKNSSSLYLTDWGNQVNDLINEYTPFLEEYSNKIIQDKKGSELIAISTSDEGFKKIPFYIGLVTFEEKFFAIKNYIQNFVNEIKTEEQKRIILYLSICHDYLGESLPTSFFRNILKVSKDEIIDFEKILPVHLQQILTYSVNGSEKYWKPRHSLFSKELKIQILQGLDNENENIWKQNLADFCIKFIGDSHTDERISTNTEGILQNLFIGTKVDRAGEMFTSIVRDIKNEDDKERVFIKLKDTYPDNPHYYSHLARFYSYHKKNRENAFYFADKAISLSEGQGRQDSLLYHIKGMCLRRAAEDLMRELEDNKRNNLEINQDKVNEVLYDLIPSAELEFEHSRQISKNSNKIDKHGYVAHIQLLIRAIDFGAIISGVKKSKFLAENKQPYGDWLDTAETLLEEIKRNDIENEDNYYIMECTNSLNELFEEFSLILQNLNTQLEKGINATRVRRQIVRTHLRKDSGNIDAKTISKILNLMEENIEDEPSNEKNFYLWFKLARFSKIKLEEAISKLARWKANSTTVDSIYYFYILKVFRALQGYTDDTIQAELLISECKMKSQRKYNIITSFEWYGKGTDLNKLVNLSDINNKEEQLEYVEGYFTNYKHDGHGTITICDKLEVFFSPTQAKLSKDDVGQRLEFYLGFSYDGLRADSSSVRIIK